MSRGTGWFSSIGRAYTAGMELQGGGVAGALLGYPLEYFFTDIGAKIIICLLIFVFLMLVTGTTILTLFRTAWKPVEKTKASIEQVMVASAEKRQRPKKIDVDIGEGYVEQEPPAVDKKSKKAAMPTEEAPEALTALERAAQELKEQEERPPLHVDDLGLPPRSRRRNKKRMTAVLNRRPKKKSRLIWARTITVIRRFRCWMRHRRATNPIPARNRSIRRSCWSAPSRNSGWKPRFWMSPAVLR